MWSINWFTNSLPWSLINESMHPCRKINLYRKSPTLAADLSGRATASVHLEKWSDTARICLLPRAVSGRYVIQSIPTRLQALDETVIRWSSGRSADNFGLCSKHFWQFWMYSSLCPIRCISLRISYNQNTVIRTSTQHYCVRACVCVCGCVYRHKAEVSAYACAYACVVSRLCPVYFSSPATLHLPSTTLVVRSQPTHTGRESVDQWSQCLSSFLSTSILPGSSCTFTFCLYQNVLRSRGYRDRPARFLEFYLCFNISMIQGAVFRVERFRES